MDMEEKKDIFDRLMHLPVLNIFEPFYKKHKEVLMYLFFGGITFFLNIALYAWLDGMLGINALIANVICWLWKKRALQYSLPGLDLTAWQ